MEPQMGPQTTRMARIDPGPSYTFGFVGAAIAVVGVVLGIISFVALDWVSQDGQTATFSDLKDLINSAGGFGQSLPGDTEIYFKWLGWVLLIVSFVVALLACLPSPASPALRGLGVLLGLAGIGLTIWAIKGSDSWGDAFKDKGIGLWLALAGFLLIAIGSAVGPQRAKY
jgi:hypothetical protein